MSERIDQQCSNVKSEKFSEKKKWKKKKESQDMKQVADQRSDKLMHDGIWEGVHDREGVFDS